MSEIQGTKRQRAPWHLWVIGIVALLWNAMGTLDYVMTRIRNEAWMSQFTPEQLDYFYSFPIWATAAWGTAVWGGVIGTLLLLLRKEHAVMAFLISLVAMAITTLYSYGISNGLEIMGDAGSLIFTAIIFLVSVALFLYSRALRARRILR